MSDVESPVVFRTWKSIDASRLALLVAQSLIKNNDPTFIDWIRIIECSSNCHGQTVYRLSSTERTNPQLIELKTNHKAYCKVYWYSKHYCDLDRYCSTSLCLLMLTVNLIASVEYYYKYYYNN